MLCSRALDAERAPKTGAGKPLPMSSTQAPMPSTSLHVTSSIGLLAHLASA